jgi:hypothetical protein
MIRFKTEKIGNRLSNWNSETESITRVKIESNSAQKHGGNIRIKLFYLFIFLAMTCSSAITVNNAINNYLKYEVVSQTRIISDQPSLFPKITICSTVTFPTKKASDLIVEIVKRVFDQDFNDFNNLSKALRPQDFLSYLEIANVLTFTEVFSVSRVTYSLLPQVGNF